MVALKKCLSYRNMPGEQKFVNIHTSKPCTMQTCKGKKSYPVSDPKGSIRIVGQTQYVSLPKLKSACPGTSLHHVHHNSQIKQDISRERKHKRNKKRHDRFLGQLPIKECDIIIACLSIRIQNTHGIAFDMFRLQNISDFLKFF